MSAQLALILLLTAALFFLLGRLSLQRPETPSPMPDAHAPRLDLNRATHAELRLIPGVGDALAERIVEHRRQHGPFRSFDDLRHIAGVGPKTLDRLRTQLTMMNEADADNEVPARGVPAKAGKQASLAAPIDVNRADLAELQKLPGIGPKLSQRIVDERTLRGPFKKVEDLRRVSGIGAKTLEKLRPLVTVDGQKPVAPAQSAPSLAYNE